MRNTRHFTHHPFIERDIETDVLHIVLPAYVKPPEKKTQNFFSRAKKNLLERLRTL